MGNYDRTLNAIAAKKERVAALRELLEDAPWEEHDAILEEIYNLEIEIGEAQGYLEELAQMDGYDSYEEYEDNAMTWEDMQWDNHCPEDEYDDELEDPDSFDDRQ